MAFVEIDTADVHLSSMQSDIKPLREVLGQTLDLHEFVEYTREYNGERSQGVVLICGDGVYSTSSRKVIAALRVIAERVDSITSATSKGNPKTTLHPSVQIVVREVPVTLRNGQSGTSYSVAADL